MTGPTLFIWFEAASQLLCHASHFSGHSVDNHDEAYLIKIPILLITIEFEMYTVKTKQFKSYKGLRYHQFSLFFFRIMYPWNWSDVLNVISQIIMEDIKIHFSALCLNRSPSCVSFWRKMILTICLYLPACLMMCALWDERDNHTNIDDTS